MMFTTVPTKNMAMMIRKGRLISKAIGVVPLFSKSSSADPDAPHIGNLSSKQSFSAILECRLAPDKEILSANLDNVL